MPSANFSSELAKVKATGQPFVDRLFSADPQEQWESVNDMRNLTAGNRRQKANFIVVGAIPSWGGQLLGGSLVGFRAAWAIFRRNSSY